MSILTLVRHGQASLTADDYDQLSDLGQEQARWLGEHWVRRGTVFDEVYTGPRARQRHTAELVGAVHARDGASWPEPVELADFDEFDLNGLLHGLVPQLMEQNAAFAEVVAGYLQSKDDLVRARNFQKAFEMLTTHWVTAGDSCAGLETWPAFRERVGRALRHITDRPGRGRRVAIFTSGGFIGTAVHLALAAPSQTALQVSWRIRNCSLTEFVFTRDRLTMDGFNAVPHLENPALWTYR